MKENIIHIDWTTAKAVKTATGEMVLEVLGAPYGGPSLGKDRQGEFFSKNTDFMIEIGDSRPVLYFHGDEPWGDPQAKPQVIGRATASHKDEKGLWFEVVLDKSKKFAERVWKSAVKDIAKASTGAINYLVRKAPSGELLTWPIGELTLVDQGQGRMAVNQLATVALKAVYEEAELEMPEAFVQADEAETSAAQEQDSDQEDAIETKKAIVEAVVITTLAQIYGGKQHG